MDLSKIIVLGGAVALLVFVTRKPDLPIHEQVGYADDKIIIEPEQNLPEPCRSCTRSGIELLKRHKIQRMLVSPTGSCN